MKCGILTYHNIPNFGAVLQAYALCSKLQKMGVECEIIDYTCPNIVNRELTPHYPGNIVKDFAYKIIIWSRQKRKISLCQDFIKKLYSEKKYTNKTLSYANREYDCFIAGSDMIWNLDVNGGDFSFFLDFVEQNKIRFSYGSSVDGKWTDEVLDKINQCLKLYNGIGVREQDTCEMIKYHFGLNSEIVCDPTMLLDSADWQQFTFPVHENNYVLVYFPYPEILAKAEEFAEKKRKKLIVIGNFYPWNGKNRKMLYSPAEWMSYIKYADAVFTDSYHGVLFSIYFQRPVWTNNKGSRVNTILKRLGLENCLIENDPDMVNCIDFAKSKLRLQTYRASSEKYLQEMLRLKGDA